MYREENKKNKKNASDKATSGCTKDGGDVVNLLSN